MDRGAWWATVHRVAKNQTRLKQLNTHTHAWATATKISQTRWSKQRKFIPHSSEGSKSKVKVAATQFLVRLSCLLAVSSPIGERKQALGSVASVPLENPGSHRWHRETWEETPHSGEEFAEANLSRCAGEELDLTSFHLFYRLTYSACPDGIGSSQARTTRLTQFGTRSTHTCKVSACG